MSISVKEPLFHRLETERLILRKIVNEDARDLYENIYNNFEWYKFCCPMTFKDLHEFALLVNAYDYFDMENGNFRWGLVEKYSGNMIGETMIYSRDIDSSQCKLGCILSYNHQKKGYAKEAMSQVINFAFNEANVHKIQSEIVSENSPSIRLAKKLGMKYEYTMLNAYQLGDKYYDQKVFCITNQKDNFKMKLK